MPIADRAKRLEYQRKYSRMYRKGIHTELYAPRDAKKEAASLFALARNTGKFSEIRLGMLVSDADMRVIHKKIKAGDLDGIKVGRAMAFREQVLKYFDELVARGC